MGLKPQCPTLSLDYANGLLMSSSSYEVNSVKCLQSGGLAVRLPAGRRKKEGRREGQRERQENTICSSGLICNPCKVFLFILNFVQSGLTAVISFMVCTACHLSNLNDLREAVGSQELTMVSSPSRGTELISISIISPKEADARSWTAIRANK